MKTIFILLSMHFIAPSTFAGVLIGNGGDSVYCHKTSANGKYPISGFYVLDYVVSFPEQMDTMTGVKSLSQSLDRIERLLREKAPDALASFLSFRATLDPAPFVNTDERSWRAEGRPLVNIRDEYAKLLPVNCRFQKRSKAFYGIYQQTVVRQKPRNRVLYRYDSAIVNDYLSRSDATQASILFVHEWLWDFYDGDRMGAPKIRSASQFLHSLAADSANSGDFIQKVFHANN